MRRKFLVSQCVAVMLGILLVPCGTGAEEAVKAMVFFEEPVTLTAVPGKQRYLLVVLPQPELLFLCWLHDTLTEQPPAAVS